MSLAPVRWRALPPVWPLFSYLCNLWSATYMTSVQLLGEDEPGPSEVESPPSCVTSVQQPVWHLCSYLYDLFLATCLTSVQLPVWPLFSYLYDLCSAIWRGWAWPTVRWRAHPLMWFCSATCETSLHVQLPVWPLFSYLFDLCSATCLTSFQLPVWPLFSHMSDLCSATCMTSVQLPVWPLFSYMYDLCSATCLISVQLPIWPLFSYLYDLCSATSQTSVQLPVWPLFSYLERMSLAPSEVESPPYLGTYQRIRHMSGLRHALHPLPSSQR